jgi:hypothetical protein
MALLRELHWQNRFAGLKYSLQPDGTREARIGRSQDDPTKEMPMTTMTLNPDALPHAKAARIVTAIFSAFADIGRFIRSVDRALVAAEVSRDLYSPTGFADRADVPDYAARKLLAVIGDNQPANDDAKIAA